MRTLSAPRIMVPVREHGFDIAGGENHLLSEGLSQAALAPGR